MTLASKSDRVANRERIGVSQVVEDDGCHAVYTRRDGKSSGPLFPGMQGPDLDRLGISSVSSVASRAAQEILPTSR